METPQTTHKKIVWWNGIGSFVGVCNQLFLGLFWDCFRGCVDINDFLEAKDSYDEK